MTPRLRAISPDATPEEVAAIVAAVEACLPSGTVAVSEPSETLDEWVHGARLAARRVGLQRGPWRLSARIPRRARA